MPASSSSRVAPLPPPRITARGVLVAAALWTLYALLYAAAVVVFADAPLAPVLLGQASHAVLMFALSAAPWWFIVRGMSERPTRQRLAAHALGLAAYTAAVCALLVAFASMGGPEASAGVTQQIGWIAFSTAFAYVAQFALYHAAASSRRAEARERQAEELRHLSREQELRTLRSQLNPHFLFNALNTVNAQIGRNPDAARETVGQLADLLRYALDAGRRDRVPLAEELAFTRDYLDLERSRMGERLRTDLKIAPEALAAEVPPMAVQTLVENAVRHAVAANPEGGTVRVVVARDAASGVRIEVSDTGRGSGHPDPGTGIGLANTDERLRLLFGPASQLRTQREGPDGGWSVGFTLPAPEAALSERALASGDGAAAPEASPLEASAPEATLA